jgi:hypothetical protein
VAVIGDSEASDGVVVLKDLRGEQPEHEADCLAVGKTGE